MKKENKAQEKNKMKNILKKITKNEITYKFDTHFWKGAGTKSKSGKKLLVMPYANSSGASFHVIEVF